MRPLNYKKQLKQSRFWDVETAFINNINHLNIHLSKLSYTTTTPNPKLKCELSSDKKLYT